jgi:hypothetical protein
MFLTLIWVFHASHAMSVKRSSVSNFVTLRFHVRSNATKSAKIAVQSFVEPSLKMIRISIFILMLSLFA